MNSSGLNMFRFDSLEKLMTWTDEMEAEYQKAVEWYTEVYYYAEIEDFKIELKEECERKLAQAKEDIKNGFIL